MRKVILSVNDFELFNCELTVELADFYVKHKDAFRRMWRDQGPLFWTSFSGKFRIYVLKFGVAKDLPGKSAEKKIELLDFAFDYIKENFIEASKYSLIRDFFMDIICLAQYQHMLHNLDNKSYHKDPFYFKASRDSFRRLFGPAENKVSYLRAVMLFTIYMKFGGALCKCLKRWLEAEDIEEEEGNAKYKQYMEENTQDFDVEFAKLKSEQQASESSHQCSHCEHLPDPRKTENCDKWSKKQESCCAQPPRVVPGERCWLPPKLIEAEQIALRKAEKKEAKAKSSKSSQTSEASKKPNSQPKNSETQTKDSGKPSNGKAQTSDKSGKDVSKAESPTKSGDSEPKNSGTQTKDSGKPSNGKAQTSDKSGKEVSKAETPTKSGDGKEKADGKGKKERMPKLITTSLAEEEQQMRALEAQMDEVRGRRMAEAMVENGVGMVTTMVGWTVDHQKSLEEKELREGKTTEEELKRRKQEAREKPKVNWSEWLDKDPRELEAQARKDLEEMKKGNVQEMTIETMERELQEWWDISIAAHKKYTPFLKDPENESPLLRELKEKMEQNNERKRIAAADEARKKASRQAAIENVRKDPIVQTTDEFLLMLAKHAKINEFSIKELLQKMDKVKELVTHPPDWYCFNRCVVNSCENGRSELNKLAKNLDEMVLKLALEKLKMIQNRARMNLGELEEADVWDTHPHDPIPEEALKKREKEKLGHENLTPPFVALSEVFKLSWSNDDKAATIEKAKSQATKAAGSPRKAKSQDSKTTAGTPEKSKSQDTKTATTADKGNSQDTKTETPEKAKSQEKKSTKKSKTGVHPALTRRQKITESMRSMDSNPENLGDFMKLMEDNGFKLLTLNKSLLSNTRSEDLVQNVTEGPDYTQIDLYLKPGAPHYKDFTDGLTPVLSMRMEKDGTRTSLSSKEVKKTVFNFSVSHLNKCSLCNSEELRPKTYKKCARCYEEGVKNPARYCCKDCQTADWIVRHRDAHIDGTLELKP